MSQTIKQICLAFVLLTLGGSALTAAKAELRTAHQSLAEHTQTRPPLYLPDVRYVRLVTLGFDNFAADLLWFNTVNYFGKQYLGGKDYQWLGHMCDLVTSLDTRARHVFEFCASLLSWEAKDPEASTQILNRAVASFPDEYRFYYLRGFNYWYFLERKDLAKEDFITASKIPNAPTFVSSLASRLLVDTDSPETAISYLRDLIQNATDETVKDALGERLNQAVFSYHAQRLESLIAAVEREHGKPIQRLDELVALGKLRHIPGDPLGGTLEFDTETRKIVSSTGKAGLVFHGKTARTGVMKHEFN